MKKDNTYFTLNISIKKSFIITLWEIIWAIIKAILFVILVFVLMFAIAITLTLGVSVIMEDSITLEHPLIGYIILLISGFALMALINLFKNWES